VDAGELIYAHGQLSVESLQHEISRFWADVAGDPELQAELVAAGLNYTASDNAVFAGEITVRPGSSGVDPMSVVLIVSFAPTANRVLKNIWADTILPRIKRRWGDNSVGDQQHGPKA
jgi:hypothetical protein